jgi:hypothetical protein
LSNIRKYGAVKRLGENRVLSGISLGFNLKNPIGNLSLQLIPSITMNYQKDNVTNPSQNKRIISRMHLGSWPLKRPNLEPNDLKDAM